MPLNRRHFLYASLAAGAAAAGRSLAGDASAAQTSLAGEVGITTGPLMHHLRAQPQLRETALLELPRRMRDELGMRVIDIMSQTLASDEPNYLDRLRRESQRYGCTITNLKINLDSDLADENPDRRHAAIAEFQHWIGVAGQLGCRWARPAVRGSRAQFAPIAAAYRELADYAQDKQIVLLVENSGPMQQDPRAIPDLIAVIDRPGRVAAGPDTGNWSQDVRDDGLRQAFPLAVTCDFKVRGLSPQGEHPWYDLQRACQLGREAGFDGPWCMEYFNDSLDDYYRGCAQVRDLLHGWMRR